MVSVLVTTYSNKSRFGTLYIKFSVGVKEENRKYRSRIDHLMLPFEYDLLLSLLPNVPINLTQHFPSTTERRPDLINDRKYPRK